jgi:hypothetical protein
MLPGDGKLMADFFSRLAERALGMAPVVTPLIAPMTAPGPTLAASEEGFQNQVDETDVLSAAPSRSAELPALSGSRDDSTLTKSTSTSTLPPRRMAISDSTEIPVLHEPSSYNPGVQAAASTDNDRQPRDDNSLLDYRLPKHSENPIRQQPPEPAAPSVRVTHPIQALLAWMESEPLRPQTVTPKAKVTEASTESASSANLQADTHEIHTARPQTVVPKTKVTEASTESASSANLQADTHEIHTARKVLGPSEPMTVHPVTTPYREPMLSESRRMEQEPPSSSPTVRVTIGRIEVRAVMAPAPPPPKRSSPATPRVSLEDYLKRRNGGKQ